MSLFDIMNYHIFVETRHTFFVKFQITVYGHLLFEQNISTIFKKKRDLNVAYSIVELMKKIDDIENFNKKSLYILIREMTDVNTSHITSVVNVLKKHYKKIFNEYYSTGNILVDKNKPFF